jgi:hypothetical protein
MLLGFFFGTPSSKTHEGQMKIISKNIKNNIYKQFYKPFTHEAAPQLASFFYELYKLCIVPQTLLRNAESSTELKNAVIYFSLDKGAISMIESISPAHLKNASISVDAAELARQTERNIADLRKILGKNWRDRVDNWYKQICSFIWFVNFDYYVLLWHFNLELNEFALSSKPRFLKIKSMDIVENLKDFLAISENILLEKDWTAVFEILNNFKPQINIKSKDWLRSITQLQTVLSSRILQLIIKHTENNPEWENKIIIPNKTISNKFLNDIIEDANKMTSEIMAMEKENNIGRIISSIFIASADTDVADYYVESNDYFKHAKPFEYCMKFLSLYFDEIKGICNIFIIYGSWSSTDDMHNLSQSLHNVTVLREQMYAYDKTLSEMGERGVKLKYLKSNSIKTGGQNKLYQYIETINDEVFTMINQFINGIVGLYIFLMAYKNVPANGGNNNEYTAKNKKPLNEKILLAMLDDQNFDLLETLEKITKFLKLMNYTGFESALI